jgi:prepilin peptidase CpaA
VGQAPSIPIIIVVAAALIAAVTDVWKFKVHNALTLPLLLSGLIYHGVVEGASGLAGSVLGALFGFGALIGLYLLGGMGGGDVKLMAALGAWLGMPLTFFVFVASVVAAGVYAVVLVVAYGRVRETWINFLIICHRLAAIGRHLGAEDRIESELNRADRRQRFVPFAAMVAVGLIATLVWIWIHNTLTGS